MKHRRPTRFGLVFLFTLTTFVVLLITIGIFGGIIYVLAEDGGLDSSAAKLFPIIVSAFASLAMGTLFANFVLRIPLRPFKRLVEGMRRLADGHFEERVNLGELAIFSELSDSFNTLATELQSTVVHGDIQIKRNLRAYYSASIAEFLNQPATEILGIIHTNDTATETTKLQSNTWEEEIQILKEQLIGFSKGRIIFEYTIPRMGRRVDVVILHSNIVFLLEFKCGDAEYKASTYDQVYDYALDLRNFQKESYDKLLVPIMVSTKARMVPCIITEKDRIVEPIKCTWTD